MSALSTAAISLEELILEASSPNCELSDSQCEYLLRKWDEVLSLLDHEAPTQFDVADGYYFSAVNMPRGSYWVQVIAAFIDGRPEINGDHRLGLLNGFLLELELIDSDSLTK